MSIHFRRHGRELRPPPSRTFLLLCCRSTVPLFPPLFTHRAKPLRPCVCGGVLHLELHERMCPFTSSVPFSRLHILTSPSRSTASPFGAPVHTDQHARSRGEKPTVPSPLPSASLPPMGHSGAPRACVCVFVGGRVPVGGSKRSPCAPFPLFDFPSLLPTRGASSCALCTFFFLFVFVFVLAQLLLARLSERVRVCVCVSSLRVTV